MIKRLTYFISLLLLPSIPLAQHSLSFDGSDDYVGISVGGIPGNFSVAGWMKFETANNSNAIFSSTSDEFIRIDTYNGNKYLGYNSTTGGNLRGTTPLSENTWYHLAVVRSSGTIPYSTIEFYINGSLDSTFTETTNSLIWTKIGINGDGSSVSLCQ